jgi:acyl-CoA thioesterase
MDQRTAATWVKSRVRLLTPAQQTAGLAFSMDGALAFLPLVVTGQSLTETEASASLDFSLRIFRPPDLNEFSLHEQHTEQGAHGRTFSVGKWYDRTGRLVANMSQTGILRMKSSVAAKL